MKYFVILLIALLIFSLDSQIVSKGCKVFKNQCFDNGCSQNGGKCIGTSNVDGTTSCQCNKLVSYGCHYNITAKACMDDGQCKNIDINNPNSYCCVHTFGVITTSGLPKCQCRKNTHLLCPNCIANSQNQCSDSNLVCLQGQNGCCRWRKYFPPLNAIYPVCYCQKNTANYCPTCKYDQIKAACVDTSGFCNPQFGRCCRLKPIQIPGIPPQCQCGKTDRCPQCQRFNQTSTTCKDVNAICLQGLCCSLKKLFKQYPFCACTQCITPLPCMWNKSLKKCMNGGGCKEPNCCKYIGAIGIDFNPVCKCLPQPSPLQLSEKCDKCSWNQGKGQCNKQQGICQTGKCCRLVDDTVCECRDCQKCIYNEDTRQCQNIGGCEGENCCQYNSKFDALGNPVCDCLPKPTGIQQCNSCKWDGTQCLGDLCPTGQCCKLIDNAICKCQDCPPQPKCRYNPTNKNCDNINCVGENCCQYNGKFDALGNPVCDCLPKPTGIQQCNSCKWDGTQCLGDLCPTGRCCKLIDNAICKCQDCPPQPKCRYNPTNKNCDNINCVGENCCQYNGKFDALGNPVCDCLPKPTGIQQCNSCKWDGTQCLGDLCPTGQCCKLIDNAICKCQDCPPQPKCRYNPTNKNCDNINCVGENCCQYNGKFDALGNPVCDCLPKPTGIQQCNSCKWDGTQCLGDLCPTGQCCKLIDNAICKCQDCPPQPKCRYNPTNKNCDNINCVGENCCQYNGKFDALGNPVCDCLPKPTGIQQCNSCKWDGTQCLGDLCPTGQCCKLIDNAICKCQDCPPQPKCRYNPTNKNCDNINCVGENCCQYNGKFDALGNPVCDCLPKPTGIQQCNSCKWDGTQCLGDLCPTGQCCKLIDNAICKCQDCPPQPKCRYNPTNKNCDNINCVGENCCQYNGKFDALGNPVCDCLPKPTGIQQCNSCKWDGTQCLGDLCPTGQCCKLIDNAICKCQDCPPQPKCRYNPTNKNCDNINCVGENCCQYNGKFDALGNPVCDCLPKPTGIQQCNSCKWDGTQCLGDLCPTGQCCKLIDNAICKCQDCPPQPKCRYNPTNKNCDNINCVGNNCCQFNGKIDSLGNPVCDCLPKPTGIQQCNSCKWDGTQCLGDLCPTGQCCKLIDNAICKCQDCPPQPKCRYNPTNKNCDNINCVGENCCQYNGKFDALGNPVCDCLPKPTGIQQCNSCKWDGTQCLGDLCPTGQCCKLIDNAICKCQDCPPQPKCRYNPTNKNCDNINCVGENCCQYNGKFDALGNPVCDCLPKPTGIQQCNSCKWDGTQCLGDLCPTGQCCKLIDNAICKCQDCPPQPKCRYNPTNKNCDNINCVGNNCCQFNGKIDSLGNPVCDCLPISTTTGLKCNQCQWDGNKCSGLPCQSGMCCKQISPQKCQCQDCPPQPNCSFNKDTGNCLNINCPDLNCCILTDIIDSQGLPTCQCTPKTSADQICNTCEYNSVAHLCRDPQGNCNSAGQLCCKESSINGVLVCLCPCLP